VCFSRGKPNVGPKKWKKKKKVYGTRSKCIGENSALEKKKVIRGKLKGVSSGGGKFARLPNARVKAGLHTCQPTKGKEGVPEKGNNREG